MIMRTMNKVSIRPFLGSSGWLSNYAKKYYSIHTHSTFNDQHMNEKEEEAFIFTLHYVMLCNGTWYAISDPHSEKISCNLHRFWATPKHSKSYFIWNKFLFIQTSFRRRCCRRRRCSRLLLSSAQPTHKCHEEFIDSFIWYIMRYNFWWCRRWNVYFLKCD